MQGTAAVAAIAASGGFLGTLPKDLALPSWTYLFVGGSAEYTLLGARGPRRRRLQVDCYGNTAAESIALEHAIDAVLSGFSGTLTDLDSIKVDSILMSAEPVDFGLDPDSRSYRRMIEYEVTFFQ